MDLAELLTRFERYAGPYDHDLTRAECGCCTFLDRETEARWLGFWGAWEVATNTEREACAKVCEMEAARVDDLSDKVTGDGHPYLTGKAVASDRCARNIRMRSNAGIEAPSRPYREGPVGRIVMPLATTTENEMAELKDLIGKTLTKVEQIGEDEIVFLTNEGRRYKLYHSQDCCESVTVEDIVGDLNDLVGEPILIAEEATSSENPAGVTKEYQDSFTWTFYKFATRKGYVDIRWYGESNGYYSESVDFEEA